MYSIGQFESLWRTLTYGSASQIEKLFAQKDIINALQEGFRPVEKILNYNFESQFETIFETDVESFKDLIYVETFHWKLIKIFRV